MKKNYNVPELNVVFMNSADVIQSSPVGIGDNENDNLVSALDL